MKKKFSIKALIVLALVSILGVMCYLYFKDDNKEIKNNMQFENDETSSSKNTKSNNATTITSTSEVTSGLTEKINLHATYYVAKSYIQNNQTIQKSKKMLKYTNGTYLTAPYDCIITEINIPNEQEKCINEHYIQISSINNLQAQFQIDESKVNNVSLGQNASIEISAYDRTINGLVTNISNTANSGKFTVTVEFENDGDIMIGMTANITIK